MSKANEKTNVCRLLSAKKVSFNEYTYPPEEALSGVEVAEYLHQDPARVFKTLVTVAKSGQHYVFVIPAAEELDRVHPRRMLPDRHEEVLPYDLA